MSELLSGLQDRTFAPATSATGVSYLPERRLSAAQLALAAGPWYRPPGGGWWLSW